MTAQEGKFGPPQHSASTTRLYIITTRHVATLLRRNGIDFDNQWIEIEKKASPQQQATAATAALLLLKAWSGGPWESQLKEREGQVAPERYKTPLLTALKRWGMGPVCTSKSQREGGHFVELHGVPKLGCVAELPMGQHQGRRTQFFHLFWCACVLCFLPLKLFRGEEIFGLS